MSADTLDKVAHAVLLHCPLAGKPLAMLWAANAFSALDHARDQWSWRLAYGQIQIPAEYSTGTISITSADPTLVVGVGTTFTQSMVGRTLFVADTAGIEIAEFVDTTHIRLARPWALADLSGSGYTISQQYVSMPADFQSFISVVDPSRNQRLYHKAERRELDKRDPRRSTTGQPYVLAEAGYSPAYSGSIDSTPFQVRGSGATPYFGGSYSGASDALYTVEITTGGASGTAVFKWRMDSGAYTTGVVTDAAGVGLTRNVNVYFPTGVTYDAGDIFVARAVARSGFGLVRYEMWPRQLTQSVYPYYYVTLPPDMTVAGATFPRTIHMELILRGAMAECRAWPGRGSEPNPLYDIKAADRDLRQFERDVEVMALRDDEMYPRDVSYFTELPFAGPPWDASWEQRHA